MSLVGAGPGDPGLLTIKAARRLGEADVIYHDALVSEAILTLCRPGARQVPVGQEAGLDHDVARGDHRRAWRVDAGRGLSVVRLKGGDPFVFGRGGEEALALLERGVAFEIVPGISAGIAVPAAAGIPVTHRGVSSSVAFVTAHDAADVAVRARLAPSRARGGHAGDLHGGNRACAASRRRSSRRDFPRGTEAAVIESGTRVEERVLRGTLDGLGALLPSPRADRCSPSSGARSRWVTCSGPPDGTTRPCFRAAERAGSHV